MVWTWAAARCRGTSHVADGSRCQDAFSSFILPGDILVGLLCDGAGSAAKGGEGASLVARVLGCCMRQHYRAQQSDPDDDTIFDWLDAARDTIAHAASQRDLRPRDFACTLVATVAHADRALVIHVGDGCVVGKSNDEWQALTWPAHGEYASTTYFVTDDPTPRVAIQRIDRPLSAVVAFTDGLERLALDFATQTPHAKFFDGIIAPVVQSQAEGRDRRLSQQLQTYLDSPAVNARTDDDKTLLLAVWR